MSKHGEYVNKLLKKIKKGDHKAFKELYNCTYNHLRVVACRYLRNLGVIEDVMQELYMRVYKYVQNADLEKDGYNWMCKIAENCAYEFNKLSVESADSDLIDEYRDPKELFSLLEDKLDINKAILTLSEEEISILYKRFWEDSTYETIAEELNSKKSTIHKKIKLILEKLRKEL